MLAAWLTRDGVIAHAAYDDRQIARRPAIPRKIFGAVLTGAGLGVAALASGSLVSAAIFAVIGAVLHGIAFSPDPLRDKGFEGADGVDRVQTDRVERAVREAEAHLTAIGAAAARTGDRTVTDRVTQFSQTARKMFRTVQDDPRDLTAARRFLGVYLLGARDATIKFADLHGRQPDPQARDDFLALLDDLERNYASKTDTLLLDDRTDLDVEIEVLRDRLAREMPLS
jgi:hypothetical protein